MWHVVNDIAARVASEFPMAKIETFAYGSSATAPPVRLKSVKRKKKAES